MNYFSPEMLDELNRMSTLPIAPEEEPEASQAKGRIKDLHYQQDPAQIYDPTEAADRLASKETERHHFGLHHG